MYQTVAGYYEGEGRLVGQTDAVEWLEMLMDMWQIVNIQYGSDMMFIIDHLTTICVCKSYAINFLGFKWENKL